MSSGYSPLRRWLREEQVRAYQRWRERPWCAVLDVSKGWPMSLHIHLREQFPPIYCDEHIPESVAIDTAEQIVRQRLAHLTWRCHICGDERPDAAVAVHTVDLSGAYGLPPGTMSENIRYCRDRASCERGARTSRLQP